MQRWGVLYFESLAVASVSDIIRAAGPTYGASGRAVGYRLCLLLLGRFREETWFCPSVRESVCHLPMAVSGPGLFHEVTERGPSTEG